MKESLSLNELLSVLPDVTVTDTILGSSTDRLRESISNHPRGILLVGSDLTTRRLLVERVCPDAYFLSCCSYVLGTAPSREKLSSFSTVCLLDVDMPGTEVEGAIKGLFTDIELKQTIIGIAESENKVPCSLLRAGRFEVTERVILPMPSCRNQAWQQLLQTLIQSDPNFNFPEDASKQLSMVSPGFGYPDFCTVLQTFVGGSMTSNGFPELKDLVEKHNPKGGSTDLYYVRSNTTVISERTKDDNDWGKHGGYNKVKKELLRFVEWPVRYENFFQQLNANPPRGVLIHGPHGCGKSLLAETFLKRLNYANWLHVEAPDLFSKYLGDSEARIRELFERARQLLPCIILIDELDAIGARRGFGNDDVEGTGVEHRVLGSLLTELDGISENQVFVLAIAHSVENLDPALIRPGRIDHILKVELPNLQDRQDIISKLLEAIPVSVGNAEAGSAKKNLAMHLASITCGFTGADLEAICRQAAMTAVEETEECEYIETEHFLKAVQKMKNDGKQKFFLSKQTDDQNFMRIPKIEL